MAHICIIKKTLNSGVLIFTEQPSTTILTNARFQIGCKHKQGYENFPRISPILPIHRCTQATYHVFQLVTWQNYSHECAKTYSWLTGGWYQHGVSWHISNQLIFTKLLCTVYNQLHIDDDSGNVSCADYITRKLGIFSVYG